MSKKLYLLVIGFAIIMAGANLESCSSYRGIAFKPDGHNHYHPDLAMIQKIRHHQNDNVKYRSDNTVATAKTNPVLAVPATLDPKTVEQLNSIGLASTSTEVPALKSPKELYKLLTNEERSQARQEMEKILAKKPILKHLVANKFKKLDEKYPAPAQSTLHGADGGGLSLGEILAIVAIALSVTFFLSIAGMIIGIVALLKINRDGGASWAKILAILAIVFGAILFVGFIIWLALFAIVAHRI